MSSLNILLKGEEPEVEYLHAHKINEILKDGQGEDFKAYDFGEEEFVTFISADNGGWIVLFSSTNGMEVFDSPISILEQYKFDFISLEEIDINIEIEEI